MPIYKVKFSWSFVNDQAKKFTIRKLAVVDSSSLVSARDRVSRYWLSKFDPQKNPDFTIESVVESESIHYVIPRFIPNNKQKNE